MVRVPYVGVDKDNLAEFSKNKTDWAQSITAPLLYDQQGKLYGQLNDSVLRGILVGNERINKSFPGVKALDNVNLKVRPILSMH